MIHIIIPWDIAVQNQGGWAPKTGSFYTGVSLCGWAPLGRIVILYRSQGVKLELGGLRFILGLAWCIWCWGFLFYIDFHFMLDSSQGLGFNLCTMPKCTLKIKPLFRFFHCEAWGSWLCSQPSLPSVECRPFFYLKFHTNWTLEASIVYSWILLGGPEYIYIEKTCFSWGSWLYL